MSWESGKNQLDAERAEREILEDPSLGYLGKAKALETLHNAIKQPGPKGVQMSDMAKGALGAGLGAGVGTIMGRFFGAKPSTINILQNAGMGLGSLLGTGVVKMSHDRTNEERKHAFRLGFVKAALELGMITADEAPTVKEATFILPADFLLTPWRTALQAGNAAATNTGALAGNLTGFDSTDQEVTGMLLEQRELEGKAEQLEAQRRSQALRSVLNKRLGR